MLLFGLIYVFTRTQWTSSIGLGEIPFPFLMLLHCSHFDTGSEQFRARHWHWPDGPTRILKLSGQFGPPVFKFY